MFALSKFFSSVKGFFAGILALIVAISQGGSLGLSMHGVRSNPLSVYSYSFYGPTEKILHDGPIEKNKTYTMYAAKNESEFCQIVIRSTHTRGHSYFEITDFENENGDRITVELFKEYPVETYGGLVNTKYYDALVPCAKSFNYSARNEYSYAYAISIKTDENTVPGDYTATVKLGNYDIPDNEYENETAALKLHVWDFTLPDAPAMDTAMGLEHYDIAQKHGVALGSAECDALYKKYYDFMLEHRISVYDMPYDILDSRADEYMSDPRVKSFRIPYGSDEQITAYYNKLSQNPEWMKKGYFYPIDEPSTTEHIERYNEICERLSRLFPGYHMVTPFYTDSVEGLEKSSLEIQNGKSDIICPISDLYDEDGFSDAVSQRVANGDKAWWYVCCGPAPTSDYCNLFVQQSALKHRILFWQQKQYDVTGLLYWDVNYWRDTQLTDGTPAADVWESSWTTPWTGDDTFGDGSLLYNGSRVGINGPVSSIRLESVANGIEDYEYFTIAEKLLGRDAVDKIIGKVSKSLVEYTYSDSVFDNARIELGSAIENAAK